MKGAGKRFVVCVTCKKEVEVELVRYGYSHIAICPLCKKLAYNENSKEEKK